MTHKTTEREEYALRASRINLLRSTSPAHQLARLTPLESQYELALARLYGAKLTPIMTAHLLENLILESEILVHLSGGQAELPTTAKGWDNFARGTVAKTPMARLCIESADTNLRETIRQSYISKLSLADKINKSRNGTLDSESNDFVTEELRRNAGLL
ncbi:MAG: hypothetical protein JWS10_90 [Cypionkella sp.]|uniref:hypothetical protein n=1 Tax=Cypionkella sp. TaxID=2811411 RepID=UPI00262005E8|nr:hypothetical protein [Cypionkella sp.]MDB5657475.1 hypothetical protein [Cypionkella sp.]